MDIDLLGPLRARLAGTCVTPTAAKPRQVLAMLSLSANQFVPTAELHRELWGDNVPRSAAQTLQTYILHLRKHIRSSPVDETGAPTDPKQILVTRLDGYLLNTGSGAVDVHEFERLAEAGHRAGESGDFLSASEKYGAALNIWEGKRPLADVHTGPVLTVGKRQLLEAHLNVLDRRIDADLRLGRHHEVLGELTALVAEHPRHEGLYAHLMVALHRSGRRGDAIITYQHACERMGSVGTSPTLDRLHGLIAANA
ncbi:MAG TPA: AfsR/SARP family transcriptional regulator [Pseudonocardiaceae bacterium]|nr:AfsR/SARP family transcriptional regulator [Pseudonocardiaceae bacterium]